MTTFQMYLVSEATGQKLTGLTDIDAPTFREARTIYRQKLTAKGVQGGCICAMPFVYAVRG